MVESRKSIMFTGAPATGKTTMLEKVSDAFELEIVPDHTTRPIRPGEEHGVEKLFLSVEDFIRNFNEGWYLQRTIEQTTYNGNHYGSPVDWINKVNRGEGISFISVSVNMAEKLKMVTTDNILWVHLMASYEVRKKRLEARMTSPSEIEHRLSGKDIDTLDPNTGDLMIDTTTMDLTEALKMLEYYLK